LSGTVQVNISYQVKKINIAIYHPQKTIHLNKKKNITTTTFLPPVIPHQPH